MMHARRRYLVLLVLPSCLLGICVTLFAQTPVAVSQEHQPGIELYRQANYEAAAKHFQSLIKKNKADDLSSYYLGLSLERQGKFKEATKALENALKVKPSFAMAHSALSNVYLRRNKPDDALKAAKRALILEPTLAGPHYVIGIVTLRSGLPQQALDATNEAIKLDPEMPGPHLLWSLAVIGLHTKNARDNFNPRILPTSSPPPPTPEQAERRRQNRVKAAMIYKEAAGSLETYLRLQPHDSSTEMWRQQLETLRFYGNQIDRDDEKTPASERLWFGDEVTTKARLLTKPEPGYTPAARKEGVTGLVIMRAVLAADGRVRHILVLTQLPHGLTEEAVRAAQGIKFEPATINGTPVSMAIQLEYYFNLY